MQFWDRVKDLTKGQNTKLIAVAEKAGLKIPTFNGWIARDIMPNADQAVAIASALDCSVEFLVLGEDQQVDGWVLEHRVFISDCKDMHPDQFLTMARTIHSLAEDERARRPRVPSKDEFKAELDTFRQSEDAHRQSDK